MVPPKREENQQVIPELWDVYNAGKVDQISDKVQPHIHYGCCFPEKNGVHFTYLCGTEVEHEAHVPEGFEKVEVDGGKYAVFEYKGLPSGIAGFTETVYGSWLPASGLRPRYGVQLEIYDEYKHDPEKEDSVMNVCIPVE